MSGFPKLRLGDLCDKITDGTHHSPTNLPTGKYKYITAKNIKPWGLDLGDVTYVDEITHREIYARCDVRKHDILYIKDGATTGVAILNPLDEEFSLLSSVGVLRPGPAISPKYLVYALQEPDTKAKMMDGVAGVAITRLTLRKLADAEVPVAPFATQTRIVEKLEELLSDLDAGVAELKAAQKKLAQYRQSLLKAAVEGALTAEWRAARAVGTGTTTASFPRKRESSILSGDIASHMDSRLRGNDGNGETGGQLLQRILTERRARWEAKQLAKFNEQGKTPPKDWQKKYPEPVQPDTSDVPELPEGWVWASVDQLSEIQGGIQKQPSRAPITNKYPYLRVANVARGQLKLEEIHEIELFDGELERLALKPGDVLVVEGNGSLTEIGRCALWDGSIENAVHQNHLIRVRPIFMESAFVETWLNSSGGIERLTKLAATTSGLYTLSVGKISRISVPVPPLGEQGHVIEILMTALDEQLRQQVAVEFALKQSAAQRKNILKAAFSGQLVPQDPNDEPASVLLERIRAERAKRAVIKKPRGRSPREGA